MTENLEKATCGAPGCGYIVGMSNRNHLSVKTPDGLIYFYGGMAVLSCKLCHALNIVVDDEYEKNHAEIVLQAERMLNAFRSVFVKWYPNKNHDRDRG